MERFPVLAELREPEVGYFVITHSDLHEDTSLLPSGKPHLDQGLAKGSEFLDPGSSALQNDRKLIREEL